MFYAVVGLVLCAAGCVLAAYCIGWLIDRALWRRRTRREQQAAPKFRVIDGGHKTDWRALRMTGARREKAKW